MALSPGEQALVDRGIPVTSTTIPAAARDRINAAIAIKDRVNEIQAAEGGDTESARYQIAVEAQKAGVSAEQIADALGGDLTASGIGEMARSVGVILPGYTPPADAGVAQSTAIDSVDRSPPAYTPESVMSETTFDPNAPITREGLEYLYNELLGRPLGSEGIEYWLGEDVASDIDLSETPTSLTTFGDIQSALMDTAQAEYQNRQAVLNPDAPAGGNPYKEGTAHYNVYDWFQRNPNATDAEIAAAMSYADVPPQLVSQVTGVPIDDVISRYNLAREASLLGDPNIVGGQPIVPVQPVIPTQPTVPGQGSTGAGYTPGGFQYTPFDYTNMPAPPAGAVPSIFSVGGVFGPGQGMPQVPQVPGVDTGLGTPPAQTGTGTTDSGSRTLVSPGITTYAYPQPFGNINIFDRPAPSPYVPPASSTSTTTQEDMGGSMAGGLENLSPAQLAMLGNIFGNL